VRSPMRFASGISAAALIEHSITVVRVSSQRVIRNVPPC
jgi:hypothetical protein